MTEPRGAVIALHQVTFLVPAQRFLTHFSITRGVSLAVVDEFALRLLAVCGPIEMGELIRFFGFTSREGSEVLRSLVARDFVSAPDGALSLTDHGRALFAAGQNGSPRIVAVEERSDTLRMDLMDFRLVEESRGDVSLGVGVPLDLPEGFRSTESPESVGCAFQEQFGAYVLGRGFDRETRLYATLSVEPRSRFQLPIELGVNLRLGAGGVAVELDFPRQEDSRLGQAVQAWFNAQSGQQLDDREAWRFMKSLIPDLSDTPPSLARIHDFSRRLDPEHTWLVGSCSVPSVADALLAFVERQAERSEPPTDCLRWLPPASEFWFRSRSSWTVVDALRRATDEERGGGAVLVLRESWADDELRVLRKRFNEVVVTGPAVPPSIEVVLVPGAWCAVWAWLKVDGPGVPLPVGFATASPPVVGRLTDLLVAAKT